MDLAKEINIIVLLTYNLSWRLDQLEKQKVMKFKDKEMYTLFLNNGKKMIPIVNRLSDMLTTMGKEDNPVQYAEALNDFHKFNDRLDIALSKIYGKEK